MSALSRPQLATLPAGDGSTLAREFESVFAVRGGVSQEANHATLAAAALHLADAFKANRNSLADARIYEVEIVPAAKRCNFCDCSGRRRVTLRIVTARGVGPVQPFKECGAIPNG